MNIIITGGSGFLGSRLCKQLAQHSEVTAPTHAEMDITDAANTMRYISERRPDLVIHCAAISSTAEAQQHPELSMRVNVEGTRHVAQACRECGARMIFISSDQVYNGITQSGPLSEDTPLAPTNVYGRHKLEAERIVAQLVPEAIILRMTWMYDFADSPLPLNKNIITALQSAKLSHTPIKACIHEYRGISHVGEVVKAIAQAISSGIEGGVYNFGSENRFNSYDTYRFFAQQNGVPTSLVIPDDTWQRNLAMSTQKINEQGIFFTPTVSDN